MTLSIDKIRTEGNSLFIKMQPATGLLALTSFLSIEQGTGEDAYFDKVFRYSIDGVLFSDWQALIPSAITNLTFSTKDVILIELQYEKRGSNSQALPDPSIYIETTAASIPTQSFFDNTIFKQYFEYTDIRVVGWYVNVLDKLYQKGVIPNYIDRMDQFGDPSSFIEFWRSIANLFAYYVVYARVFESFYEDKNLLSEFLEQRGLTTSPSTTIEELNLLTQTYCQQMMARGTGRINNIVTSFDRFSGEFSDEFSDEFLDEFSQKYFFQGELLRLIHYNEGDEFIFNLHKPEHFGWNLRKSSPLYRSPYLSDNANKFKDFIPQTLNLYSGATITQDEGHNVLSVVSTLSLEQVTVSESLDYEFSFLIKLDEGARLTVSCAGLDREGNSIFLVSQKTGANSNVFLEEVYLSDNHSKYLIVRMFVYNSQKTTNSNDTTEIKQGNNLRTVEGISKLNLSVQIAGGSALIYGVRFLPLITPYSHGLIQANNWISYWLKNNNNKKTLPSIEAFVKKYLLPINANFKITNIN